MSERNPAALKAEALLKEHYAISFEDIGLSDSEWLARFGDLPPGEAVDEFANKFDLVAVAEVSGFRR